MKLVVFNAEGKCVGEIETFPDGPAPPDILIGHEIGLPKRKKYFILHNKDRIWDAYYEETSHAVVTLHRD
jgi:hypothetical protein